MDKIIGKELKSLNNLIRRYFCSSALIRECDNLTGVHSYVLGYLYHESRKRDVFQRDIEEEFELRRSTASGILKLMEQNGLILRESVESDARLKKIILTDKANDLQKRIHEEFAALEKLMCSGVSDSELRTFFSVADKIKKNIADELDSSSK